MGTVKLTNKEKELLKEIYRELGYDEYYVDHPDKITDFHGEDLQEVCLTVYKFASRKDGSTSSREEKE